VTSGTLAPRRGAAPEKPLWRIAAGSFLPVHARPGADRWLRCLPLGLVLALQSLCSLRLHNSAFQDEALYIHTGRLLINKWTGGEGPSADPATYFSGAPQLYPVWAGLLDEVGGLTLVRLFSTLCMLSATVAVYWTTQVLFAHRREFRRGTGPAVLAALIFALSSSVLFLGDFATFDAMSFTMIAWAMAVGVWSTRRARSLAWTLLVGLLCALAVLVKYSAAVDVPFVLALIAVSGRPFHARQALTRGVLAGCACVAGLAASVLTWAAPLLAGLEFTTTHRAATVPESRSALIIQVLVWDGVPLLVMLTGAALLLRRSPALALVLGSGTLAAPAYQIHLGEAVSLHKHVALGLLLGAPLAGLALARVWRAPFGVVATIVTLWAAFLLAVPQSNAMFSTWPDTTVLKEQLTYSIKAMPWIRMVGDNPEPLEYQLQDSTHPWQWTATYDNSFFYQGSSGIEAYRRALHDNYFQLAFLDGSYPLSQQLIREMRTYGFRETSVVRTPYTTHAWHIYQRFDHLTP
jgi:hypothetical protein